MSTGPVLWFVLSHTGSSAGRAQVGLLLLLKNDLNSHAQLLKQLLHRAADAVAMSSNPS